MSHRNKALVAIVAGTALLISSGAAIGQAAIADERSGKAMQTLNVDFATETGNFRGGASGTLYGLGDDGSPADAILDGAQVENSSQKPPSGTQHPSGDALALENQFFSNGGNELAVYMQDYYPDWSYNSGNRPSDSRTYVLDVPVDDPSYGTYTNGGDGVWDYEQVTEIVINKVLANTEHPDQYTFIPFNEPDGGNWYASGDNASAKIFRTFLSDWDSEYKLIQKIWQQYKNGEKPSKVKPTADHARVAGPGDCVYRQNRSSAFLSHAKSQNTLPDVFVWHELGKESLSSFRSHYESYRKLEKKYGINRKSSLANPRRRCSVTTSSLPGIISGSNTIPSRPSAVRFACFSLTVCRNSLSMISPETAAEERFGTVAYDIASCGGFSENCVGSSRAISSCERAEASSKHCIASAMRVKSPSCACPSSNEASVISLEI